jgi:hypothetical protein
MLEGKVKLSRLWLGYNGLGDGGAAVIAKSLMLASELTFLELRSNSIGVEGATAVASMLEGKVKLSRLWLGYNGLGDGGAAVIAKSLMLASELTHLDLRSNSIGVEGATAVALMLEDKLKLSTLWLGTNDINDEGALALTHAAMAYPLLEDFDLSGNNISPNVTAQIRELIPLAAQGDGLELCAREDLCVPCIGKVCAGGKHADCITCHTCVLEGHPMHAEDASCIGHEPSCEDNDGFRDQLGFECSGWIGYDCLDLATAATWSYTAENMAHIQLNCAFTCVLCDEDSENEIVNGEGSSDDSTSENSGGDDSCADINGFMDALGVPCSLQRLGRTCLRRKRRR